MDKKKMLLAAGKLALQYLETRQEKNTTPAEAKPVGSKSQTPPGIAGPGEKVISLVTTDHSRWGEMGQTIRRGEIMTVQHVGYANETYCFVERPASYTPYLGEEATWWYPVQDFLALDERADRIIAFLDRVEARIEGCVSQMQETLKNDLPQTALNVHSSREDYQSYIAEYRTFAQSFEPLLKTEVEEASAQELKALFGSLSAQADREIFSLKIHNELEKAANELEKSIRGQCDWVFPDEEKLKNRSALDRMKLPLEKKKRISELPAHIEQDFSVCLARCRFKHEMRNQYVEFIISALQETVRCVDFPDEE